MSMGAMSDVLGRATLVRLDVYDANARCAGATVADGAAPPTLSKVASAGQPIKLDVPAGRHVLLLSAFGDATGTQLLGSACIETDVKANQPACFNLALADAPDLAEPVADVDMAGTSGDVDLARQLCSSAPDSCPAGQYCATDGNCAAGCKAPGDCAATPVTPMCKTAEHRCVQCLVAGDCPLGKQCSPSGTCVDGCIPAAPNCKSGDQCCSMLCIDVASDIFNCGSCGRACSSAHVTTAGCNNKLCAPQCSSGWADCNHPISGTDDGCETNVNDVARCGACNAPACNLAHATPDCPAGACTVKSCNAGYFDCDAKASTGCECAGANLGGATPGCCPAGTCQTAHTDGFGHSFYDCISAYSEQLARDAAKAYAPTVNPFGNNCPNGTTKVICSMSATACTCWAYADTATSNPATGRARENTSAATCFCPTAGDQPWN
ncbi:MAG: Tryptophan synthase alpha chain [Myxococcales bacterium]|nr:Tryptophan synthase alpha chain [Myxococcales bacterium]